MKFFPENEESKKDTLYSFIYFKFVSVHPM